MEQFSYCVNCSTERGNQRRATVYEIPIAEEDLKEPLKKVKVQTVLSSVYKLEYLNDLKFVNTGSLLPSNDDELGVCEECCVVLVNLFRSYIRFSQLRLQNSYLSNTISNLDDLMHRLETLVEPIPPDDDNIKDFKSEENKDDEETVYYDNLFPVVSTMMDMEFQECDTSSSQMGSKGLEPVVLLSRLKNYQVEGASKRRIRNKAKVNYVHDDSEDKSSSFRSNENSRADSTFEASAEEEEEKPTASLALRVRKSLGPPKLIKVISDGKCPCCPKQFKVLANLSVHLLTHVPDGETFICPVPSCCRSYRDRRDVAVHLVRHTQHRQKKCPVPNCPKLIDKMDQKRRHLRLHMKDNIFVCEKCDLIFESEDVLQSHKDSSHEKILNDCPTCPGKIFGTELQLTAHIKADHPGEKMYHCIFCANTFGLRRHLLKHTEANHQEGNFKCELGCSGQFKTEERLRRHQETCKGHKIFPCSVCSRTYRSKKLLDIHEKVHKGEVPAFDCSFEGCGKSFTDPSSLRRHLKNHSEDRPFTCHLCGMSFKKTSLLRNHLLTHSGDKQNLCSICGKKFLRLTGLTKHMKAHSDLKEYPCSECDKVFKYPDSRRLHFLTQHTPGLICPICGDGFPYSFNLKKHMSTVHNSTE